METDGSSTTTRRYYYAAGNKVAEMRYKAYGETRYNEGNFHFYPSLQYAIFKSLGIVQRPKNEPLSGFSITHYYGSFFAVDIWCKTVGSP